MTKSPYDQETGTIRGGFKPPFKVRSYSITAPSLAVVGEGENIVCWCSEETTAQTLAAILNEYVEMKKHESAEVKRLRQKLAKYERPEEE